MHYFTFYFFQQAIDDQTKQSSRFDFFDYKPLLLAATTENEMAASMRWRKEHASIKNNHEQHVRHNKETSKDLSLDNL